MLNETWYPSTSPCLKTGCGDFYLTIVLNDEETRPIFVIIAAGKAGGCARAQTISLAAHLNTCLKSEQIGDRLHAYSELIETSCHVEGCCVHLIAKTLFDIDLHLDKMREEEEEEDA